MRSHKASKPPKFANATDIADFVGMRPAELTWWAWGIKDSRRYKQFTINKRSGGTRLIESPAVPLKRVQAKLAKAFLASYDGPVHAHGFVAGRSTVSNATQHRRQSWTVRVDLTDFFPSIGFARVRGVFKSRPFFYPDEVATLLAQLCCFRDGLPQGAPTSPVVSNYICRGMDADIARLAADRRCYFTRYADDLCFSTDLHTMPEDIVVRDGANWRCGDRLSSLIAHHGFEVNPGKTSCIPRSQRQLVTGLVVNEKTNLRREYLRMIRTALHIWERYGKDDAAVAFERSFPKLNPLPSGSGSFGEVLRGHIAHVGAVRGTNDAVYRKLATRYGELAEVQMKLLDAGAVDRDVPRSFTLMTEGVTDIAHIQAAERYFHERGEFKDVAIQLEEHSACGSDKQVKKHVDEISKISSHKQPQIGVVDQDTSVGRGVVSGNQTWEHLANGVVLLATPIPPHRDGEKPFCIEMSYPKEVLELESENGRRLFLREEFDPESGIHNSKLASIPNAQRDGLVSEEVYRIADNERVGLKKSEFASLVTEKKDPYSSIDFEGFRPLFEQLREALDTAEIYIVK